MSVNVYSAPCTPRIFVPIIRYERILYGYITHYTPVLIGFKNFHAFRRLSDVYYYVDFYRFPTKPIVSLQCINTE